MQQASWQFSGVWAKKISIWAERISIGPKTLIISASLLCLSTRNHCNKRQLVHKKEFAVTSAKSMSLVRQHQTYDETRFRSIKGSGSHVSQVASRWEACLCIFAALVLQVKVPTYAISLGGVVVEVCNLLGCTLTTFPFSFLALCMLGTPPRLQLLQAWNLAGMANRGFQSHNWQGTCLQGRAAWQ